MSSIAGRRRPLTAAAALAVALGVVVAAPAAGPPAGAASAPAFVDPALRVAHGTVGVIVQGAHSVESQFRRMGGRVTHDLPLIGGFSARVPATDVPRIAQLPGATAVSLDRATYVQSAPGTYNDVPSVYKKVTGGAAFDTAGARGQGVTVALIDTGVSPLPDVKSALVQVQSDVLGITSRPCLNLTSDTTCNDSYGHGTFMAGLIAGNGTASGGTYVGMAPAAKILSIKIAGASGASDVSTIIAALQWVVQNRAQYNIRALNLSVGTDSTQSYTIDPLDYAVEQVWKAGVVVNVAASNRGPASATISDPANDPFVITVGAIDDRGTVGYGDDVIPNFSGRGPTATDNLAKPDVVAPGAHLVSLAAPGATITNQFPSTMTAPYRRGSGTSMATAVVTGLVADMISAQPTLTPDRVKYMLMSTAHPVASDDVYAVGRGLVDGRAAMGAGPGVANVGVPASLGTGSLAAARGSVGVVLDDTSGTILDASSGCLDSTLTCLDTSGANWFGANWFGANWFGANWFGANWFGANWFGANWFGANWFGVDEGEDYGANWFGSAWYGAWDQ